MTERRFMIYGCNGYTGELLAREAKRRGLSPLLAGRNRAKVEALAAELSLPSRVFGLEGEVAAQLTDIELVLHCAGPFAATCAPMIEACAQAHVHYTDITGEIDVFEYVHARSDEYRRAGIVALPGVGVDVVPTDCLAAMLHRDLPDATHLELAFVWPERLSPGTMKSSIEGAPRGGRIRKDGALVTVKNAHEVKTIPFADRPRLSMTIPWGDVSTAYYSTAIPNIAVFAAMEPALIKQAQRTPPALQKLLGLRPVQAIAKGLAGFTKGPNAEQRQRARSQLYGQVSNARGETRTRTASGPDTYDLTVSAALAVVERVLDGGVPPGATTPSRAFGPEFGLQLPGMEFSAAF